MDKKRLFLLDAYALIYRAYYAFIRNPRYNTKGENTSAAYGFTNTLNEVLSKHNPTHIAVVFDPPTPTFRHEIFKEYKATREPTPEDIKSNVPYIKQIIEAFNIPVISIDYYEADDTIGTLATKAEKKEYQVYMMTSDKDYCQLVSDSVFLFKPKRSGNDVVIWGIEEVQKEFKVEKPDQVIDILALWGDTSDNIPGIPGIGEKTAKKLIAQYGCIDNLYKNINKLKPKQKENLRKLKDQLLLSKKLVTIVKDVDVELNEEELKVKPPNIKELERIFNELEFKTLINRVLHEETPKKSTPPQQGTLFGAPTDNRKDEAVKPDLKTTEHHYQLVDNKSKRDDLNKKLKQLDNFCFDTETTSLDIHHAELVGIAFSFKAHEAYYVTIPKDQNEAQNIVDEFKPVLEDENITKTGQNIKFDIHILSLYNVNVQGALFDTMIAHYLIQPELRHGLTDLSEQYLNYTPLPIENLIGKKGKNQRSMRQVNTETIKEYAGEDADITWQLKNILHQELNKHKMSKLFSDIEMPLVYVLADMERNGFRLNTESIENYAITLREKLQKVENTIFELAGMEFNIASPKQLGEILFDRLKISDNPKKTKTKQYATGEQELQKLKDNHKIVPQILEFRGLKKLLTGYVESLPKLIDSKTNKIHSSFNQTITSTGRLSSTNPNLQNIPIRDKEGKEIRKAFVPTDDHYVLLSADYSQIELRIMAHLSQDENMIAAFQNNEDIHTATAAKINRIEHNEVSKEMRYQAKSANFGIIYGISSYGLSQNLGISKSEAKTIIDNYFKTYPKIKEYMDEKIKFARDNGYVTTIMNRRRYLKDINSRNGMVKGMAERNAINTPVQGSAADIIKLAMIKINERFKQEDLQSKMILQVHDELVFDVYKPELQKVKDIVKYEMEHVADLSVPLSVEMGIGKNWLEAH